jgi:hypothetical protein
MSEDTISRLALTGNFRSVDAVPPSVLFQETFLDEQGKIFFYFFRGQIQLFCKPLF